LTLDLVPELARRVADAAIVRFDALRATLPPDPKGWARPTA
jgi:hypothetical protein